MSEQLQRLTYNNDEIDLVELLRSLFQQKCLILVVACLITLGAAAYAFLSTPHYQVQSVLRPVDRGSLDELSGTGVYELTPGEALSRVGAGLSSYENRLAFFRENQALFSGWSPRAVRWSRPLKSSIIRRSPCCK